MCGYVCVILKNSWCMPGMYQQVGVARTLQMERAALKQHQTPPFRVAFDAPHHPHNGGLVYVPRRHAMELWPRVSLPPSFSSPPRKLYWPLQKKNKAVYLFVCEVKLGSHSLIVIYWFKFVFSISSIHTWFLYQILSSFF